MNGVRKGLSLARKWSSCAPVAHCHAHCVRMTLAGQNIRAEYLGQFYCFIVQDCHEMQKLFLKETKAL